VDNDSPQQQCQASVPAGVESPDNGFGKHLQAVVDPTLAPQIDTLAAPLSG